MYVAISKTKFCKLRNGKERSQCVSETPSWHVPPCERRLGVSAVTRSNRTHGPLPAERELWLRALCSAIKPFRTIFATYPCTSASRVAFLGIYVPGLTTEAHPYPQAPNLMTCGREPNTRIHLRSPRHYLVDIRKSSVMTNCSSKQAARQCSGMASGLYRARDTMWWYRNE